MTAALRRQFCGWQDPSYLQRMLHAFGYLGQDHCFSVCPARMRLRSVCPERMWLRSACPARMRLRTAFPERMCLRTVCPARMCRQPAEAERIYCYFALLPGRFYFFAVLLTGLSFCFLVFVRQVCRWSSFSMSAPSEGKNTSAPGCGREKALLCRSAQDPFGSLTEICEYRIPLCIRRQMLPENVSLLF